MPKGNKTMTMAAPLALVLGMASAPSAQGGPDEYVGEILMVGYNFCPRSTTEAAGQLLTITSNTALFSLYGTTFGGDGRTTFGLPDLRGRVPMGQGTGPGLTPRSWGQKGGAETQTLSVNQMPSHNHMVNATDAIANKNGPGLDFLAKGSDREADIYHDGPPNKVMDPGMIANEGGGQAMPVQDPYLVMRYCVVLQGIYPSRN